MFTTQYLVNIHNRYKSGITTEHSFRGDLQTLLEHLLPGIMVTNEPTRISCGAPDYILTSKDIPVGYIEAKDLGADLTSKGYDEQFKRYRDSLENLIFTNYIDFHFYRNGELTFKISIAHIESGKVKPEPDHFAEFENRIKDFSIQTGQTIKSAEKLSKMMAVKARLLANVIENALNQDEREAESMAMDSANNTLRQQLAGFKQVLIHDIEPKEFADIYAQTIAYGMFAARLHDPSIETFTRKEAAELIPKSNPFLRKLFQYIAGYDLDPRITWIVDGLADIFRATDVNALLKNFGKSTQQHDPIIHFYETFLSEYDPKLRKARGVWYTPEPVVKFIVRAVDDILKTEFNLPDGLADTSKTKIKVKIPTHDKRHSAGMKEHEQEVHKIQILDPATGTGTFLAEVIKHIYKEKFEGQQGIWSNYVENHLIPRLNGFELLMASYAMAHLKLDMLLTETGYKATKDQRLRVYLTNSLEEYHPETGTLFASWLSGEANEANQIKRDVPVMAVIGNPPYSLSSSNKGNWILNLINDYKSNLNERKLNLDDDYIKFIKYGQHLIDKTGEGILAYISNNSFIDGITHRQMRSNLLESFNKIYIIDLHGSAKKNETAPDGSKDENVFDIQQGVSINIFIKSNAKFKTSSVHHYDLFGSRESKYEYLLSSRIKDINWHKLEHSEPYHFFVPKDFSNKSEYDNFFKLDELMQHYVSGFQTKRDKTTIHFTQKELIETVNYFKQNDDEKIRSYFDLPVDGRDWKISWAKEDLNNKNIINVKVLYRPFDERHTIYTGKSKGFIAYPRDEMYKHLNNSKNYSLITCRQESTFEFQHVFISRLVSDMCSISSQTKETGYIFPLFLKKEGDLINQETFQPNLNQNILTKFSNILKSEDPNKISPDEIFDYIYSVLHSPKYRNKYKEFLKIDFPKIPFPKNRETFEKLKILGNELRDLHLLECQAVNKYITKYPEAGSNEVDKIKFDSEKVWINDTQYFSGVPVIAWNFYIGGYQPAQKWLKDRKGRKLSYEDIQHYQKIIVALVETDRIMKEIDKIDFL